MQWFKTMTTNAYLRCVKQWSWPPVRGQLWQRNYHERVIRNEDELSRIREYVQSNPLKWQFDRENPNHHPDRQYEEQWKWLEGGRT